MRLSLTLLCVELLGSVLFGVGLQAWDAWEEHEAFSVRTALVLGVFFLVGMTAFTTIGQVWAMRGTPRGQSITAHQESTIAVDRGPAGCIVRALQSLPAQITEIDVRSGRYVARTRRPRYAAAEVVVQLGGDPAAPVARETSSPIRRRVVADNGAGQRNVRAVVSQLTQARRSQPQG